MVEVVVATVLLSESVHCGSVVVLTLGFWIQLRRVSCVERRHRRKDFARLLLGAVELAVLSVWLSPRMGLVFRPELATWAVSLGEWTTLASFLSLFASVRFQLVLFGLLLAANESNLFIRAMFDWLDLKPRSTASGSGGMIDMGEFNRGRIIGMLERVLLYSFVLQAQYGAIGFILAAKAFTRFKALDDRPFAEYVLIGTLLSACLALANGGMVRWLLAAWGRFQLRALGRVRELRD